MSAEVLIETGLAFDSVERTEVELIDHLFGFKAGIAGQSMDETKPLAWKLGWTDAHTPSRVTTLCYA
jgi:ribosome modulation factor